MAVTVEENLSVLKNAKQNNLEFLEFANSSLQFFKSRQLLLKFYSVFYLIFAYFASFNSAFLKKLKMICVLNCVLIGFHILYWHCKIEPGKN